MVLVQVLFFFLAIFVLKHIWEKRWLYYYGWKIEGPFAWPLIGSAYVFFDRKNDFYKMVMKVAAQNPEIFKIWLGSHLVIFDSNLKDIEIILTSCFDKSLQYKFIELLSGNGLLTAPVNVWKGHRKIINPTFSSRTLSSFFDVFAKYANKLVEDLQNTRHKIDIFLKMWRCTFDIVCETLADVDPVLINGQDEHLQNIIRGEEILTVRAFSLWLYPDFIWTRCALGKELRKISNKVFDFTQQLIKTKKLDSTPLDDTRKRKFLNHVLYQSNLNENEILHETHILTFAGSETTAIAMSFALQVLGIYKNIQEKVYQEIYDIFKDSTRNPTPEDINRMVYLEAVIKETLRLMPPAPIILRCLQEDLRIDGKVFPKGTTMAIPIGHIHRREDLWKDPLIFNPDRFLSEEVKIQHHCTFMPFSFGPRNCIGFKYGMISMKVILSTLIRRFKIFCPDYKSISEIEVSISVLAKATNGYKIQLEPRLS